jgi:hypothetical protein
VALSEESAPIKIREPVKKHRIKAYLQVEDLPKAGSAFYFEISANGKRIGRGEVGRGSFKWYAHHKGKGHRIPWPAFAGLLNDHCGITVSPVTDMAFDLRFPKPEGLRVPKGAEWPDFTGDKIIWQMLAARKYTRDQIVATACKHDHDYTPKIAGGSIPIVKKWMKKLRVKANFK